MAPVTISQCGYRRALSERTPERVPLAWSATTAALAHILRRINEQSGDDET